jgi:hypothetical protein
MGLYNMFNPETTNQECERSYTYVLGEYILPLFLRLACSGWIL